MKNLLRHLRLHCTIYLFSYVVEDIEQLDVKLVNIVKLPFISSKQLPILYANSMFSYIYKLKLTKYGIEFIVVNSNAYTNKLEQREFEV